MRKSPLKHPLAVLRTRIGLGQKEFANLAGCSWRTIQSIELLNLKLSAKLADRISEETGAGFHWLMQGNPDAPMVDDRGLGWRREAYFDAQGRKVMPGTVLGQHYATDFLGRAITQVCAAVIAAAESNHVRAYIWRVLNGISAAVEDLKDYPDIVHRLNGMLVQHIDDTHAGREAVIRYAVERIRKTKEPRPKRVWKKRPTSG